MKTTTITLLLLGYYCICCAQQIQYQAITSNFDRPVDIATEHLTSYFYIVEQDGEIELTDVSGNIISAGFLDIKTQVIGPDDNYPGYDGELGLLGMAFHPNFNLTNAPYFYVNYTVANDNFDLETIISRFTVSSTPNQNYLSCDANSEYIVMRIPQPRSNHNAGDLVFGPDGYLYIGTGDSGGSDDPDNQAQNLSSLLGKILRIDINGDDYPMRSDFNYSIPNANPFANNNMGLAEIYAYGLRNPWRFSFDNNTGDLWIADVGQNAWEEINFIVYQENTIQNFGWSCFEGLEFNYSSTQSNCPFSTNTTLPIFAYPHNMQTGGFSVTGGFVYRGCQYPALYGQYIFADYVSGNTWLTDVTSLNSTLTNVIKEDLTSFGEDIGGEIFYVTLFGEFGKIIETSNTTDTILINKAILSGTYQAKHTIITTASINANQTIEMITTDCIQANEGFEVGSNATVLLAIENIGCP